ncbi:MAG TPA: hypothetical protein VF407_14120, partial [Polyangiaceae bacterium]
MRRVVTLGALAVAVLVTADARATLPGTSTSASSASPAPAMQASVPSAATAVNDVVAHYQGLTAWWATLRVEQPKRPSYDPLQTTTTEGKLLFRNGVAVADVGGTPVNVTCAAPLPPAMPFLCGAAGMALFA